MFYFVAICGWFTCLFSHILSQGDRIYLLKLLALKGDKVFKEKLQIDQTQYLGHLILEQRLHLDAARLHDVLSFPSPQTKYQLQGFLGLIDCCQNWIPNVSLLAKPLYILLKNDSPDPISWEEQDDIDFKALKESLINPLSFMHPIIRFLFSFGTCKERECVWNAHSKIWNKNRSLGYYSQKLDPVIQR